MNRQLKQDIRKLAALPGDPGIPAFRALFRMRAGDQAAWVEKSLRSMIFMMPDLLERVRIQGCRPGMPKAVQHLYGYLLTYLYQSRDLIPEDGNGFFGFVDDAYLVAAAYERTAEPEADRSQARAWMEAARWIMPAETAQLDQILDELVAGKTAQYEAAITAPAYS